MSAHIFVEGKSEARFEAKCEFIIQQGQHRYIVQMYNASTCTTRNVFAGHFQVNSDDSTRAPMDTDDDDMDELTDELARCKFF